MADKQDSTADIDWSKTSWEGSRREQLRQWQKLTVRERLLAVEEMNRLSDRLGELRTNDKLKE